ncbi:type II toxin-antitoxin system HicB family antitoxin [Nostoc sp. 'Peltigera membranacea cyanobiont' N6]|uniref:type II toxin-antitoxin system HicB family antitoxin n=1 Tax=Nostoc sp. 'Peltigera membranacea cyanobiont' N6 TaxID=1261031 RepID=UPI0021582092|nr:hypothetical protein [Nostoc sp. 'Peltigera membranacea cyanobiont' N6]
MLEDGTFYGEILECQGVWANAATLEACREDLQDTLEGWIVLGLRLGHTLPILYGEIVYILGRGVKRKGTRS